MIFETINHLKKMAMKKQEENQTSISAEKDTFSRILLKGAIVLYGVMDKF
tara:strand:+ start:809 stop:958 length:150 start_codon:yes stop_codon:yes gene_type:complete